MKKRVYDKPRILNQQVPDSGVMEPDRGVKIALVFDETNQAISRTHICKHIYIREVPRSARVLQQTPQHGRHVLVTIARKCRLFGGVFPIVLD